MSPSNSAMPVMLAVVGSPKLAAFLGAFPLSNIFRAKNRFGIDGEKRDAIQARHSSFSLIRKNYA